MTTQELTEKSEEQQEQIRLLWEDAKIRNAEIEGLRAAAKQYGTDETEGDWAERIRTLERNHFGTAQDPKPLEEQVPEFDPRTGLPLNAAARAATA